MVIVLVLTFVVKVMSVSKNVLNTAYNTTIYLLYNCDFYKYSP